MPSATLIALPPARRWTEPAVSEPSNSELARLIGASNELLGRVDERVKGLTQRFDDKIEQHGREIGDLRTGQELINKSLNDPNTGIVARLIALEKNPSPSWSKIGGVVALGLTVLGLLLAAYFTR